MTTPANVNPYAPPTSSDAAHGTPSRDRDVASEGVVRAFGVELLFRAFLSLVFLSWGFAVNVMSGAFPAGSAGHRYVFNVVHGFVLIFLSVAGGRDLLSLRARGRAWWLALLIIDALGTGASMLHRGNATAAQVAVQALDLALGALLLLYISRGRRVLVQTEAYRAKLVDGGPPPMTSWVTASLLILVQAAVFVLFIVILLNRW
jgi:hypothetical protein